MDAQQLQQELERAATSLLTDDEIVKSLGITQTQLNRNYAVVERARLKLKQKLNAKRINDAAQGPGADQLVQSIPKSRAGGRRPGAGRPAGSTNKISIQSILTSVYSHTGENLEDLIAQGYAESIENNDRNTRLQYEKMFLGKVVGDRVSVEHSEDPQQLEHKQAAFREALAKLNEIASSTK
jgi:hypothetical protein